MLSVVAVDNDETLFSRHQPPGLTQKYSFISQKYSFSLGATLLVRCMRSEGWAVLQPSAAGPDDRLHDGGGVVDFSFCLCVVCLQ